MLLGGLRSAEVRGLRLADVDMGRRRLRVTGKGGRERYVPVDPAFFSELAAYLRLERPAELTTPECFVALRDPTAGRPVTEAGLRSLVRRHRQSCGAVRVRPHRLRHTYGIELAAAGIDLLARRELMSHSSPETTGPVRAPVHRATRRRLRCCSRHDRREPAVTAALAREPADQDLLAAYRDDARALGLSGRAIRDRERIARDFLTRHPDLHAWMTNPAASRAAELKRTGAWPHCWPGHGDLVAGLTAEAVDAFDPALASSMTMPQSSVRAAPGGGRSGPAHLRRGRPVCGAQPAEHARRHRRLGLG